MKNFFVLTSVSLILLDSCKKKGSADILGNLNQSPNPTVTYPHFFPTKAGSYWIYERFDIKSDGTAVSMHEYDSSYVEKDTIIGNYTYTKIRRRDFLLGVMPWYIRDSLHYIVSRNGRILFSSEDFVSVLDSFFYTNPRLVRSRSWMTEKDLGVSTPAGYFTTSNFKTEFLAFPPFDNIPQVPNPRYNNMRYTKGIGVVIETEPFFLSLPWVRERRLIRYHIAN
jgi:hypothetical protein